MDDAASAEDVRTRRLVVVRHNTRPVFQHLAAPAGPGRRQLIIHSPRAAAAAAAAAAVVSAKSSRPLLLTLFIICHRLRAAR